MFNAERSHSREKCETTKAPVVLGQQIYSHHHHHHNNDNDDDEEDSEGTSNTV